MEVLKGVVASEVSENMDGSFLAELVEGSKNGELVSVAYTSPRFTVGEGGIFAPPKLGTKVLIFADEPKGRGSMYYYACNIVEDTPIDSKDKIGNFKVNPSREAYNSDLKPSEMSFKNEYGQGLAVTRRISNNKWINRTSLDAEIGGYVSVGDQGVYLANEHGDCIILQGEKNDIVSERTLMIETEGPQIQNSNHYLGMHVGIGGDDIQISNQASPPSLGGTGPTAGNIRIQSKYKDIILRTGSPGGAESADATRNVQIITPKASIVVDGLTGKVTIQSTSPEGGIEINSGLGPLTLAGASLNITSQVITADSPGLKISPESISLAANGNVSIAAGGQLGLQGATSILYGATNVEVNCPTLVPKNVEPNMGEYGGLGVFYGTTPPIPPTATVPPVIPAPPPLNSYGDTLG